MLQILVGEGSSNLMGVHITFGTDWLEMSPPFVSLLLFKCRQYSFHHDLHIESWSQWDRGARIPSSLGSPAGSEKTRRCKYLVSLPGSPSDHDQLGSERASPSTFTELSSLRPVAASVEFFPSHRLTASHYRVIPTQNIFE